MAMQGRRLNRKAVFEWNEPWSSRDRVWITAALDAIPNGVCILPPSGGYIGVWTNDQRAMLIRPGYLEWPNGRWARDLPGGLLPDMQDDGTAKWHLLSTFQPHGPGTGILRSPAAICMSCGMELPLTGVCDNCD